MHTDIRGMSDYWNLGYDLSSYLKVLVDQRQIDLALK